MNITAGTYPCAGQPGTAHCVSLGWSLQHGCVRVSPTDNRSSHPYGGTAIRRYGRVLAIPTRLRVSCLLGMTHVHAFLAERNTDCQARWRRRDLQYR